jgi:hypothetical protein
MPWQYQVLGERTRATRDYAVRAHVIATTGVTAITEYFSVTNPDRRAWAVALTIDTIYGAPVALATKLPASIPPLPPPAGGAQLLGIVGGPSPLTGTVMQPADLSEPQSQITEFQITRVDSGRF